MKKLSKINENTFVDIIKKDKEDYIKEEEKTIGFLQEKIIQRIEETKGSVIDLRDLRHIVSYIDSLNNLFEQCNVKFPNSITEIDVTGWNTSNVTNMGELFCICWNIKKIIGLETWDVSNVTDMQYMFYGCHNLKELNISNWNVSKVEKMCGMFYCCKNIEELNISNWNVSNVDNMIHMFDNCKNLKELNIENWDVSNVENMSSMFAGCNSLEKLPSWYKENN